MHLRPLPGVFTILACLIPLIFCAAFVELNASPPSWGAYAEAVFLFWAIIPAGGICLLFGFIAGRRGEPRAARVIVLSILVSVLGIAAYLPFRPNYNAEEEAKERARTWGATGSICGFVVQPDGRIVIAGAGLARLLPDGARDLTFRPDTDRGLYRRLGVCGELDGTNSRYNRTVRSWLPATSNSPASIRTPLSTILLRRRCPIVKSMLLRSNPTAAFSSLGISGIWGRRCDGGSPVSVRAAHSIPAFSPR